MAEQEIDNKILVFAGMSPISYAWWQEQMQKCKYCDCVHGIYMNTYCTTKRDGEILHSSKTA